MVVHLSKKGSCVRTNGVVRVGVSVSVYQDHDGKGD